MMADEEEIIKGDYPGWHRIGLLVAVAILWLAACGREESILPPTEEEQIKNLATGYFVRDPNVPPYAAHVEAVVEDWARVSLAPVGVESTDGPMIMYLQNQANTDNPVATAQPLDSTIENVRLTNDFGWVVITKPQAQFSDEELDELGVPTEIRP